MNIEESLYTTLIQIGFNVDEPQEYVMCRVSKQQPDLVLGVLKKEDAVLTILVGAYLLDHNREVYADPELIVQVFPSQKRARIISCEWATSREWSSLGLHYRIRAWLQKQMACGHNFRGPNAIHENRYTRDL